MGGRGCVPGVARARCPVFIALANRSIADSDTAQLGSPRTELETPFPPRLLSPFRPCPSLSLSEPSFAFTLYPTSYLLGHPFRIKAFSSLFLVCTFSIFLFFLLFSPPFFLFLSFSFSCLCVPFYQSSLFKLNFFSRNIAIGEQRKGKREKIFLRDISHGYITRWDVPLRGTRNGRY